jgi:1-deoxy-D-xylulose-5-phosphate reductoisomerase
MQRCTFSKHPDYDVYIQTDAEARRIAEAMLKS